MTTHELPDFTSREFLFEHAEFILAFYEPRVRAADGSFYQCFKDDGTVYDTSTRHLVSSTRFVFNYATAYRLHHRAHYQSWARDGLLFLENAHRQRATGHYAWVLNKQKVEVGRAMAYGHAFVLLAAASCLKAGIAEAAPVIDSCWDFVERYFWHDQHSAYADERNESLSTLDPYRGQNANMHMCEALLATYDATGESRFLDRAQLLAQRFTMELAALNDGLIWEHYTQDWQCDMQYNIEKPDDLFKPWGFQPGHQVEWAKLLLTLNAVSPDERWVMRAKALFDKALQRGWDANYGGLVYGFAPDGSFCDSHKYFWVQAEAIAAAWRLYKVLKDETYLNHYQQLWRYSWRTLVDHEYGAWFRIRNRDGSAVDDLKSPPGKTDYHTLGACWDVLSA